MCGIAGFIDKNRGVQQPESRLDKLAAALRHRGPDDRGTWSSSCGVAHFAHTRLSILDLSAAGHQPMSTADGRFTITFNGEIYNFRQLRSALETDGCVFHTGTDTEVILALYEKHGEKCLGMLDGMFAFAIWDARERTCFLARDAFGIKPLYYSNRGGIFAFASEIRALQQAGFAGSALNARALCGYFETGSVPEPGTLLEDVRALTAGCHLLWRDGCVEKERWWSISFSPEPVTEKAALACVREALEESMRRHFVSDVPVGIFLSGGIDSTALVALARHIGVQDISTFSIGVDDPGLDESSTAARTARHFNTRHHELRLDSRAGRERFEAFIQHIDQPSIDGFNTFTVSSFARESGLKVVLSGLGGDEMFAGYPSFQKVPGLLRAARWIDKVPGLAHHLGLTLEYRTHSHRMRRLGAFLQGPLTIARAYGAFRGIFSRRSARILAARYAGVPLAEFLTSSAEEVVPEDTATDELDEVSRCELSCYMRHQLLKDSDVMSMAHNLELRVPFVDRRLFEAVRRVPALIRLQAGKRFLTDAIPELPPWVVNQSKKGFVFPYQQWARSTWGDLFEETNARLPVRNPVWYQTWAVFMLDRWLETRP